MDSLIAEMNADGFNGDTMDKVPEEFYTVSTGIRHSVAIEPEGGGNIVDNEGANCKGARHAVHPEPASLTPSW